MAVDRVVAALSVSGPSARLDADQLLALRPDIVEAAGAIREELGRSSARVPGEAVSDNSRVSVR